MRYGSVCSGIDAATVAWHPLGWKPAFFSEIEAAPRAALAHHYPDVPCHGDFTTIGADEYGPIDLLVGGTPCQSFSIAGLRGGLADDRGNLALEYLRLADRKRPRWLVWENVPGVLSIDGGRAFGAILGGLAELGYGFAYRILDAQYFGVPQRRRRVFVIGYLGDWRRAAAVLFERHSMSGHPAPRRQSRKGTAAGLAPCLNAAFGSKLGLDNQRIDSGAGMFVTHAFSIMPMNSGKDFKARETDVAQPLMAGGPVGGNQGGDYIAFVQNSRDEVRLFGEDGKTVGALAAEPGAKQQCYVTACAFDMRGREGGAQFEGPHETANIRAANGGSSRSYVAASAVRRLTPRECERLQGFPDDYTLVPYRKGMMADGPRYKALGNSMAVPVMRWIGERIQLVDSMREAA